MTLRIRSQSRKPNGQGSILLRKDGRWETRLQVNGARRSLYSYSEREAQRKLVELQRYAARAPFSRSAKRTVNDVVDLWLETSKKSLKATTLAWYETIANKHVRPGIGTIPLDKLEPMHLQLLYANLHGRMAKAVHGIVHRSCKMAVMWTWLDSNPAERVLRPSYSAPRREVWTADELRRFIEGTMHCWLWPIWTLTVFTGCRVGELLALKWEDVDLDNGTIRVHANLQRIAGEWIVSTPKSKAGQRTITLPRDGVLALRRQKVLQAGQKLKSAASWHDTLVFTRTSGLPLHRSTVAHAMKRACRRLALPVLTPHGLRHMHASLLIDQKLPLPAVAARLGHSTPSITMNIYAHRLGDADRNAAEAIQRAVGHARG